MINYESIKPLLFKLQPENAHHIAECVLRLPNICQIPFNPFLESHFITDDILTQDIFGRKFYNPVGLGAGFDKNATMIRGMQILGFGFTEIGTVTPKPQPGNPKPRMWRHIEEKSIQNAMGFNNDGAYKVVKRLKQRYPFSTPIGINIGKNKITPEKEAINDYTHLIKAFDGLGDYFVINISSPNTPGLRDLQNEAFITRLFAEAKALTKMPILLKIAPDMTPEDAVALTTLAVQKGADGIIATNTTIDYSLVPHPHAVGGLSGAVLKEKSFAIFEAIAKELYAKTTLISVGGIDSAEEAYKRIKAGASLVQILSGIVFGGPDMIMNINKELIELLRADGYTNISQAVGADRK
ncbi:quinone-dependent dihydroorotate dehydrogenase [Sulfurimonas paralvinellae]|uniref:Dihydroorotate dehydrogenase (quinone) n=1 Tax=Sulfurimonas paralvinellae TaxID=317658 RepID=A0A7M1B848_9BACT|nr:quinone-dependent dihydroorotate dehydrogenase [Sulfurimonas paralvinellae]QOP45917.1 quinone-dependent dihydroorotate dehydrogenase [Sulfurimonas paralvinellae]